MNNRNRIIYKINKNVHDIIYTKNIVKSLEKKITDLKSDKKIIFYMMKISQIILLKIFFRVKTNRL